MINRNILRMMKMNNNSLIKMKKTMINKKIQKINKINKFKKIKKMVKKMRKKMINSIKMKMINGIIKNQRNLKSLNK